MAIQYLYPTTMIVPNGIDYVWYENGNGTLLKASGSLASEIDEGFSTVNYSDFLQSRVIFNAGLNNSNYLSTNLTRNFIVPSSIICNISCSSVFSNTRPLTTYYSGKNLTVTVKNADNNQLIAFGGTELDSGLINKSFSLNVISRQVAPTNYNVELSFNNQTSPVDFNDYFYPNVYAFELVTSGTIQATESGVPLTILGGLDTSNYQRLLAYDDNTDSNFSIYDNDWQGYKTLDYAECYHRGDISGIFNTAYFQFNEGSGNVVRSGSKSGQIFSEDNQYRWLTDGTILDSNALLESTTQGSFVGTTSGQVLDIGEYRTNTQGNGLYLGPTKTNNYSITNYYSESLSRLQGIDFYNTLLSSGNFSLYLNIGHRTYNQTTIDNGSTFNYDAGCLVFANNNFETYIQDGSLATEKVGGGGSIVTTLQPNSVITSLIHTYNSGLLTTYILYEDASSWSVTSGTINGLNCFGNIQIGRRGTTYANYNDLTLHQFGVADYAFSRTEVDNILEKISAPVNNVLLRQGTHSVPTYVSGDTYVGVSYQKSVNNTYEKTHALTNRIIFDDHHLYSIPSSGYLFMDAYVAYTGNNPSGYLGITATSSIDGNNINPYWNNDYTLYQQKVFNSGGIQRITIVDTWEDSNPYPLGIGANTPKVNILVTTPASNSYYDGGEFRLYGLEFYTDAAFYVEPTGVVDGITLYTYGSLPSSGTVTLFCGQDESFDTLNLFVKANEPVEYNNYVPLTILNGGSGTVTNYATLYTLNQPSLSGEMPLYIYSDYSPPNPTSGNLNIFLNGGQYPTGLVPLYIKNDTRTSNKGINLLIKSTISESGILPLSIDGGGTDNRSGILPLVVYSTTAQNSGITLFTQSAQGYSTLPLVVGSHSGLIATDNLELTIFSSENSGFFGAVPITLLSDNFNASMNLFIKNDDSNSDIGSLNLFVANDTTSNNYCTLFASNTNGTVNSGVHFYIGGDGVNQGAFVGTGSMNLFLNREIESIGTGVTFNISGPSGIISSVPLLISGGNSIYNSCTLSVPATLSRPSGNISIYTHGY